MTYSNDAKVEVSVQTSYFKSQKCVFLCLIALCLHLVCVIYEDGDLNYQRL